ncbi:ribosome-recycling factor, mitochondrial-like [Macrobrachium nipponense]|uniref:ribosome-recycling factor, mitochondrial-like n=1 Tax=Macrobrachium nipponense TaxID=159736 RepID=UPI0030C7D3A3
MFWLRSAPVSRMYSYQVSSYLSRMLGCLPASSLSPGENRQLTVLSQHEANITRAFPSITFQCQVRYYAKGKDKKGKGKQSKVHVSDEEMTEVVNVSQLREQFANIIEKLKEEYIKNLTLRTAIGGIETLPVELEGDKYPLNEVAQVSRKSPQMLIINAAAFPQATVGIIKAIRESGMNLNPQQEGTTIYVPVPKVTKEHRENLAKSAKTLCNRCKDQLRDTQNNFIRKVRNKEGQVSEDLIYNVQLKIREIADDHMQDAEKLMAAKQKELLKTSS